MNTTTTKADLVKPKAVSEATSPRCEATLSKIRKQLSVEVWRESGETNERFLNWQSRKVENVISNVFAELAQVTAQRDELLAALNDISARALFCVTRNPQDHQMEYVRQQANNAISKAEQH